MEFLIEFRFLVSVSEEVLTFSKNITLDYWGNRPHLSYLGHLPELPT